MKRKPAAANTLTPGAIEALLAPLAQADAILLAASGGPDSTALVLMAASWSRKPGRPRVEVATVDHALRAGAAAEAQGVAALCDRLGLPHHLLTWRGPKPQSRIQERARVARYDLLRQCAQQIGAQFLVTAHHADDQAETVLFRLLRGSGIGGLRGMDAMADLDGVTLARPLLGLRKGELVAFCQALNVPFALDPSNEDPRFARTHLRDLLARLADDGLTADVLTRLARRAGRMEDAVARQLRQAQTRFSVGAIDAPALFREPLEIAQRILTARLAEAGGRAHRPAGLEQIEALAQALRDALAARRPLRANLAGASVRLTAKGHLSFAPEAPRRAPGKAPRAPAKPGAAS